MYLPISVIIVLLVLAYLYHREQDKRALALMELMDRRRPEPVYDDYEPPEIRRERERWREEQWKRRHMSVWERVKAWHARSIDRQLGIKPDEAARIDAAQRARKN